MGDKCGPFLFSNNPMNFTVGKKLNMTQHFLENGEVVPVTVVKVSPMVVTQVKDAEGKDKYSAVQVGVGKSIGGTKRINKPLKGHLKDNGKVSLLTEFRVKDGKEYEVGKKLDITQFEIGELVNCVGTMKGRGFAGAIKRHGFKGFPASHGHNRPRSVGSIGQRYPQHVRKGLRMAGHMGTQSVTVKNLQIIDVDTAKGLLMLKGAVPGHRNAVVKITSTGKVTPLFKKVVEKDDKKKK
jgi:large subunit ribosomal protein L3